MLPDEQSDPRFRVGAYLTDETHLYEVLRIRRTGSLHPTTLVEVVDILDNTISELKAIAVRNHHRLVVPLFPGVDVGDVAPQAT